MDLLAFFLIGKLLESVDDVSSSNIVIIPLSIYQTLAMSALGVIGQLVTVTFNDLELVS